MWGVKRICVFEHSFMTSFNCACPAIQRGQGSGFLSEGSSWFTACMSEQRRFCRDCADAQARLNLRCSHRRLVPNSLGAAHITVECVIHIIDFFLSESWLTSEDGLLQKWYPVYSSHRCCVLVYLSTFNRRTMTLKSKHLSVTWRKSTNSVSPVTPGYNKNYRFRMRLSPSVCITWMSQMTAFHLPGRTVHFRW